MTGLQKLILALLVLGVGLGAFFILSGGQTDDGQVGFTDDQLERVDEDLDALIAAEGIEPDAAGDRVAVDDDTAIIAKAEGGRPTLALEGRVVTKGGAPVANAEVSLFLRRSLAAIFRDGTFTGGRRRGDARGGYAPAAPRVAVPTAQLRTVPWRPDPW